MFLIFSCSKTTEPSTPPRILKFDFEGVKAISSNIDPISKSITIEVPYQTSVSALVPIIELEDGVTVVPASGFVRNFTQDVYYTLSKGSNKIIYTIKVKIANQPVPEISQIQTGAVEAGEDLSIFGKNFGRFALDIQAFLVDDENKETLLKHQLIDSTQIKLTTSTEQKIGFYRIKIKVRKQEVTSDTKIWLAYPSPQLTNIPKTNLLKGDTLWLIGKYIDATKYTFLCQLGNKNTNYQLVMTQSQPNKLGFILPNEVTTGEYEVKIYNVSEKKLSNTSATLLSIYDPNLPFTTGIINQKVFYKKSEKLSFKTINFDKIGARFYQVNLVGIDKIYIQNGIYDINQKVLSIELPDVIQAGTYSIHFSLSEPTQMIFYSFETDLQISVKD
ncbi:MAG: hypothetical protein ACK4R6_14370 [Spirosomataceae bacterium]